MRYGTFFLKELKYKLPLALVCYALFYAFYGTGLVASYGRIELLFMLLAMTASAVLFANLDEMELFMLSRARLSGAFIVRFLTTYISLALLPGIHFMVDRISNQMMISYLTTVLFCCAMGAFWRVLIPTSVYGGILPSYVCCSAMLYSFFPENSLADRIFMLVRPFSSAYLADPEYTRNRLIVTGIALVLLLISWIRLRRWERA